MAIEFKLPDIGEGIAEGEIVKWLVSEGDTVEEHQPVVEVMTDKATVEVPAPQAGTVTEIRAGEGDVVPVGQVIFVLDAGGGGGAAKKAEEPKEREQEREPEPDAGGNGAPAAEAREPERPAAAKAGDGARKGGSTLEFKLPDIGEGIAEGEVVKWLVSEGDAVEEHQPVVEVMTDKATVEIPSPAAGTIVSRKAKEGDVVPIGQVLFELATGEGGEPAGAGEPEEAAEPRQAEAAGAAAGGGRREGREERPAGPRGGERKSGNGRVLAVPSARRVAREYGVDLANVQGSGRSGVIRRADVEAYLEQAPSGAPASEEAPVAAPGREAAPPVSVPPGERETRKPFRGVRRKIAAAMARSKFTATHFTVVEELDVTELVRARAKAKEIGAREDVKVTYMPFIMKAVVSGLVKYPELNSQLDESTQEIVTFHHVDLGIATDTEQGLFVPVVRDVQSKGLLQLARELQELAERTRMGKVKPEELSGGTFTITNAGNIGGTLATPIINFPEVGILGVHRLMKRPGVVETPEGDRVEVRQYMNLSISVDHRLVDGATAARFLVHLKEILETPGLLAL